MAELPSGNVTFLFTDVEGSTKLLERDAAAAGRALERHHELLRRTIEAHHGCVFETVGDAVYAAFAKPSDAVAAALDGQLALQREDWGQAGPLRVRMGVHTGEVECRGDHYFGPALFRCARLMAIGHGGQVLLSGVTASLVSDLMPDGLSLRDMGLHRLKDLVEPEQVWQLAYPELPSEFPPLRVADERRSKLPAQLTSFIGREKEIAHIKRLLASTRLVTLTGPGGSGKTRLAVQLAMQLLDQYADGAWFVDLAPVLVSSLLPQSVAAALDVRETPGEPIEASLVRVLSGRRMLTVLDNCEHLVDACARLVDSLLRACPDLTILATSREPLQIGGETVMAVPALATLDPERLPGLELVREVDAIRLFVDRAAAVRSGFALATENVEPVASICHQLDGIPLAIELAAARVQLLSPAQISDRLQDRFKLLTSGGRTAPARQQTLRAMVDWSHELLSEAEKVLWRRLSVFAGGWTLEAAEAVCSGGPVGADETLELLGQLVSKSLVVPDDAPGSTARYRMLETFRHYGRQQLDAAEEEQKAFETHARYFAGLARTGYRELGGRNQLQWLTLLELERNNFRAALGRCRAGLLPEAARHELAAALAANLFHFWNMRGHLREGADWLLTIAQLEEGNATPAVARCLAGGGYLNFILGNRELGISAANRGVELAEQLRDPEAQSWARFCRGLVFLFGGDAVRAEEDESQAARLADQISDRWLSAFARQALGGALDHQHKFEAAREVLDHSLEISRELGDWFVQGLVLAYSGQLSMHQGDCDLASSQLAQGIRLLEEMGAMAQVLRPANLVGQVAIKQGELAAATARYRRNIEIVRDFGWPEHLATALAGLAITRVLSGAPEQCAILFGAAAAVRARSGITPLPLLAAEEAPHMAAVRSQLAGAFEQHWSRGAEMSAEQAIEYALAAAVGDGGGLGR